MERTIKPRKKTFGPNRYFTNNQLDQVTLLSKLGAGDAQMALFFKVDVSSITNWKQTHPDFEKAIQRGGIQADMQVVESLFKRAIGYDYQEEEWGPGKVNPETGQQEMELKKVTKRHLVGDTKAQALWLKIKRRDLWSVSAEFNHKFSGTLEHVARRLEEIPVGELTNETRDFLLEIGTKQLSVGEDGVIDSGN